MSARCPIRPERFPGNYDLLDSPGTDLTSSNFYNLDYHAYDVYNQSHNSYSPAFFAGSLQTGGSTARYFLKMLVFMLWNTCHINNNLNRKRKRRIAHTLKTPPEHITPMCLWTNQSSRQHAALFRYSLNITYESRVFSKPCSRFRSESILVIQPIVES